MGIAYLSQNLVDCLRVSLKCVGLLKKIKHGEYYFNIWYNVPLNKRHMRTHGKT